MANPPQAEIFDTAMLFEEYLLEQMRQVQHPPKIRKTFTSPPKAGKTDFERENRQIH
jgi:hypothetical protein